MTDLTAVSLFAGIGGFDEALRRAGARVVAAVEIDEACRGVLARHFPETALFSDVTEVTSDQLRTAGFVPGRGILAGGWPCFVAGTRILAERGWLPIEDVRTGDLVLTHAGRWQPVTSVMSRVASQTVSVHGQGLPHIRTTAEHPFYARSRSSQWVARSPERPAGTYRRMFSEPTWVEAAKMADQYASQVLPPTEPAEGDADLWWLVGRYLADGWTTSSGHRGGRPRPSRVVICCAYSEADELAERIGRVVHATRADDVTCAKFVITRASFVDFVDRLGRGAAGKTLTRRELALPADLADALLSGWLTGDGCRTQGYWKGTTVSRSLALSMALLAQRARGVVASLHETAMPATDVIAGRVVGQRTQYQVVIPDRNRSAFVEGAYGWKLVRRATRSNGPVLVYNLSVAGDESYVADGAVVHNCQDLSIAGRRAGLGGARSGLFRHIVRLAGELRPRWLFLENVPGLLSAVCSCPGDETCLRNGRAVACGRWERGIWLPRVLHGVSGGACRGGCMAGHGGAMGTVVGALAELGYGLCWRVLDAQFFGVPQQRDRLIFAGCLGDGAAPVEVLLEPESGGGDPAPGREAREGAAGRAEDGAGSARRVASTLQGGGRRGHRIDAEGAAGGHLVAMPVALRGRDDGSQIEWGGEGDPAFAVRTPGGGSSHAMVAYALTSRNDRNDRNDREQTWVTHALTSEGHDASEDGTGRGSPLVPVFATLTTGSAAGEGVNPPGRRREDDTNLVAMAFAENQRGEVVETANSHQLTTGGGKPGQGYAAVRTATGVRRLTPKERERLQGFPDDWTRWRTGKDGRPVEQSDAARDRQTGNAVAVPVVEWAARRIVAVDAAIRKAWAA